MRKLIRIAAALALHATSAGAQSLIGVAAGVYWNGNGADFSTTPTTNVVIGGTSFTPTEVGRISATLEYQQIAPYIGIGYDTAHYDISPFAFRIRAGLFYMGKANVSMNTSGIRA